MCKIGELICWRNPLDADYSYGYVRAVHKGVLEVEGTGYYTGVISEIHKGSVIRGGKSCGNNKKYRK